MNGYRAASSFILFLLFAIKNVHAWDISLQIDQEASNGVGGELIATQPVVSIFNKQQTKKHVDLVGRVVATLSHRSFTSEMLGIITLDKCEVDGHEEGISVELVGGDANFSELCVNRADTDFSIKYTLFDEFNITLGETTQSGLSIEVGEPFTIGVVQVPEIVEGGITWNVSPIVAVQDRGRNTVKSVNNGTVSSLSIFCINSSCPRQY